MSESEVTGNYLDPKACIDAVKQMALHEGLNPIEAFSDPNYQINVEVRDGKIVDYVWTEVGSGQRLPSFTLRGLRFEGGTASPDDAGTGDYCCICIHIGRWARCWMFPCLAEPVT